MTRINANLVYDEDGFCRLCSLHGGDHQDECPGSILGRMKYEVRYSGSNCTRGCCGSTRGTSSRDTLEDAVRDAVESVIECVDYSAEARVVFSLPVDVYSMMEAERDRIRKAQKDEEEAETTRWALKTNTEAFTASVRALEAERGDLTPEAFARRMRELRDKYRKLGVVFSDGDVTLTTDDDDPLPPRTPEEIEAFRKDEEACGNFAVPPWEARENAWHKRHGRG